MPTLRTINEEDVEFLRRIKRIAADEIYVAQAEKVIAIEEKQLEYETVIYSADIYRLEHIRICLAEEKERLQEEKLNIQNEKVLLSGSSSQREVRTLAIKSMNSETL